VMAIQVEPQIKTHTAKSCKLLKINFQIALNKLL
jgi:hypothetical protein